MQERLVSVITPVYNAEKYITSAIESVLAQTYKNWEMIIVDDGSTDSTANVISKYLNDNRIKYHIMERNSGAAVATNYAIEKANGSLLAFLDADDYWKKDKLEKQIAFMLDNNYGFTFSGYEIIGQNGNKYVTVPKSQNYKQYLSNTIIGTSVTMIDLEIIGYDFRMVNIRKGFDSMTWTMLFKKGHIAYGLDESLAYYRKVEGSLSNDKWRSALSHWRNCREIEKIPFFTCLYYFAGYAWNAVKKHYF